MSIVKIDQSGWDAFTGQLGPVPFENGVSTRPLTPAEKTRLGAAIKLVEIDSGKQIGASTIMANTRHLSAQVTPTRQAPKEEPKPKVELKYTKDKLQEIASEGGIKAIREIAKEFDVKGVEINKIIDEIVKVQLGAKDED